jgi:hypothetical protein
MESNEMNSGDLQARVTSAAESKMVSTILRAASLLVFVQYVAHGSLFVSSITGHHPPPIAAIAASPRHSYWDLYVGYGLLAILSGVIEAVLLWQVASLAKRDAGRVRPIMMVFILANVVHACLVWTYFSLIAPVAFDLLTAGLLAFAFVSARTKEVEPQEIV